MNRLKKIIQKADSRTKKAKAKLAPKNKPKYISKAERAKLDAKSNQDTTSESESEPS